MFELEFQYPEEIIGEGYAIPPDQPSWRAKTWGDLSDQDGKIAVPERGLDVTDRNTKVLAETCKKMGYDIIRVAFVTDQAEAIRLLRKIAPDHLIAGSATGTIGIPDGKNMATLVHRLYTRAGEFKKELDENIKVSIENIKEQADAGVELVFDCTDYCLKEGPFYPLWVYRELVFPYLKMLVDAAHKRGVYFIKHTDGNISSIIEDLVATGIDALHSIDPSAGMNLSEVKALYGHRVALCGNVDAATTMAYGTPEQVAEEAMQCLRDAASGGGYFLTTSNCIYRGVPPINAVTLARVGEKHGRYPLL